MKKFYLLLLMASAGLQAQMLNPDTTFGINGVADTEILNRRYSHLAENGKIYSIGSFLESAICFNADGSTDFGFGDNGSVGFVPQFGDYNYDVNGLVSNQAHLFAFGYYHPPGSVNENIFIAKLGFDGNLVPEFGDNGVAALDFGQQERIWSAHLTASGKILCTGWRDIDSQRKLILIMINADGTKDMTFGTGGIREYDIYPTYTMPDGTAMGPDNKLYVACAGSNGLPMESCILKFDMNGDLATAFGNNGILHFNTPNTELISKLVVKGKNLYAFCSSYSDETLSYLNQIRVYDLVDEFVSLTLPLEVSNRFSDFHITSDERILTYTYNYCGATCLFDDVYLSQYTTSGELDSSFDGDGTFTFNFGNVDGNDTKDISGNMFVFSNKILVSGQYFISGQPNVTHLVMARFNFGELGIDETAVQRLRLHPNPAVNNINFELTNVAFPISVSIYNTLGQASSNAIFAFQEQVGIQVTDLASGIYFVNVTDANGQTYREKFIKQ